MTARLADTLPKSPLGLAIGYVRNQWLALKRFLENGALEIDNNTAENALRPIALGRKNYLFVGSEHGGRRAAIIYSLIRTCERHGVNAWDYLRDVLVRISTHPATQIDDAPAPLEARDKVTSKQTLDSGVLIFERLNCNCPSSSTSRRPISKRFSTCCKNRFKPASRALR